MKTMRFSQITLSNWIRYGQLSAVVAAIVWSSNECSASSSSLTTTQRTTTGWIQPHNHVFGSKPRHNNILVQQSQIQNVRYNAKAVKSFQLQALFGQDNIPSLPDLSTVKLPTALPTLPNLPNLLPSIPFKFSLDGLWNLQEIVSFVFNIDSLQEQLRTFVSFVQGLQEPFLSELRTIVTEFVTTQSTVNTQFQQIYDQIALLIPTELSTLYSTIPGPVVFIVSTVVTYLVSSSIFRVFDPNAINPTTPYPDNNRYDPITARAYFDQRLPLVVSRASSILFQSIQFAIQVYRDKLQGDALSAELEEQRGMELATLLTKLGPTFIKVGQSLSIRTDLLSPAYIRGLTTLQDQVPPFDSAVATKILEDEWKRPLSDVLVGGKLSDQPIAAASLGQVYKATIKGTGETVAIKVQRPQILEQIALDMYLVRDFGALLKRVLNLNTDTVGTVDAWGIGFIDELNYEQEAQNAMEFNKQIQKTPLQNVVFSPSVVEQYSTRRVLVTEWIDGERLDKSTASDISVLCSVAMNTYLTMLLEFGTLHCDPHPGNLLRTTNDGKLCILDWGMVTKLDSNLQLTLIEHMAHLTSADYAEIPRDLLLLGFIPESKADLIEDSGVVDVLADIYSAWTAGGGAASIDVNKVISQLQDLTSTKGNIFQIPPYFAYIAKSFSVLEGIGLSNQPGTYSIINECLPYVSKRLLSDKDTMGPALSTFIFGPEKSNSDRIINYKRVKQLIEGFSQYTTTTSTSNGVIIPEAMLSSSDSTGSGSIPVQGTSPKVSRTQRIEEITEQILDLLFTEEETPLQQIILEQVAKILAANSRYIFTELRERSGVLPTGRTVLGTALDPLGLFRTSPLIRTNQLDEQTVQTTRQLVELLQDLQQKQAASSNKDFSLDISSLSRTEILDLSRILARKVWDRRNGILFTGNRFIRTLLSITADQLDKGQRDTRRIVPAATTAAAAAEKSLTTLSLETSSTTSSSPLLLEPEPVRQIQATTPEAITVVPVSTLRSSTTSSLSTSSSRLETARKLLDSIQFENKT